MLLDVAGDAAPTPEGIAFHSALARQCFINEYVFAVSEDELRAAEALRESLSAALDTGEPVPASWLLAVATYFPLQTVKQWPRLLERPWPDHIGSLLTQQLHEPAEERRLATALRRLTEIDDSVSLAVQSQYEENPYPRWVKLPCAKEADCIESYLRQTFPMAAFAPAPAAGRTEILVAGCGTGQHPIRTAQQFNKARVLAVDLSRNSLAYAARKARELGLSSIEFAQADLLKLGAFDRRFDVIEASGVLHHLADPWTGWRTLLSLLKPGGFMLLGLYSVSARRNVARLREFVAGRGYGSTAGEIRRCRQEEPGHVRRHVSVLDSEEGALNSFGLSRISGLSGRGFPPSVRYSPPGAPSWRGLPRACRCVGRPCRGPRSASRPRRRNRLPWAGGAWRPAPCRRRYGSRRCA